MSVVTNLLNLASNEFRGDTINRIAGALGESSSTVQAALNAVIPALVGGLASKASTSQGASELFDLLKRNRFDTGEFSNAANAISSTDGVSRLIETGGPLLNSVFGSRVNSVIDWVTSFAGIKKVSASSLLSLALPVILGLVGKHVSTSLMSLLGGQKAYLESAPAGLSGLLGFGTETPPRIATYPTTEAPRAADEGWWKWLLPLLALAAILGYFLFRDPIT